jgi:hypothetical protein
MSEKAAAQPTRPSNTHSARYHAFISYAREDERVAAALQASLINLVRTAPPRPQGRIRVFRDATDLIPGKGLSEPSNAK